jgi:hypothetical protein
LNCNNMTTASVSIIFENFHATSSNPGLVAGMRTNGSITVVPFLHGRDPTVAGVCTFSLHSHLLRKPADYSPYIGGFPTVAGFDIHGSH